ncbi:MAG: hypothetical protein K6T30_03995 [Alicyclobacillus sp.]|nr:hypothetical protein [Alicyclobacillus sp.]
MTKTRKAAWLGLLASAGAIAALGAPVASAGAATASTFTTIYENHPITVGAPLNPFNTNNNTFLSFDVM